MLRCLPLLSLKAVSALPSASLESRSYLSLWEQFQVQYGKNYGGESSTRFAIFSTNVDFVRSENAKGHTYTLGINRFSDLTTHEFYASYTGYQSPNASELYSGSLFAGYHTYGGEDLPLSVDWTTKGAVSPIKDQGHCGSCWAFSATGALEGAFQIATGTLTLLSEQQIVDCDHSVLPPTLGCNGGSMSPVFNYAKKNGHCTEASYPYEAKNGQCRAAGCTPGIPQGMVTGFKGLAPVGKIIPASKEAMMSAVAQQPVSVAIQADKPVFHAYQSGVVTGDCGHQPNHGVLVVGYGTDTKLGEYWKVKNSWGSDWGEVGFVRVSRNDGGWKGECDILGSPTYPVIAFSSEPQVVV